MTIAVCDDERIFRVKILELLENYKKEHFLTFEILEFSSGEELLNYKNDIFLVFLDVEMPGRNGMEIAKLIKEKKENILIVFLTSHSEMMQKAFQVKAFRYLLKPLRHRDFLECMESAMKEMKASKVLLSVDGIQKVVNLKEIQYIEAGEKNTFIRTKSTTYESKYTMTEWVNILADGHFFRCHKTYYINLAFVDEIHKEYAVLYNKERVAVSRRSRKEFNQKLLDYIKSNSR